MDRQEARMGFNRGIQQEEAGNSGTAYSSTTPRGASRIREVWKNNLDQEMAVIRGLLDKYPYVGMV